RPPRGRPRSHRLHRSAGPLFGSDAHAHPLESLREGPRLSDRIHERRDRKNERLSRAARPHPMNRSARHAPLFTRFLQLVSSAVLSLGAASSPAFEYDRPIEQITHLPVTLVQKPFVLRFSPEELLKQPIWSKKIDGIVLSN